MVNRIYPPELHLNKANTSDTEAPYLDLHLSISNGFVSSKIYDKCDDFDFDIVNFPFLDGDLLPLTGFTILNLFGLLECLVMWLISMPVIKVYWCCSTPQGSPGVGRNTFLSCPRLCFIIIFICDLFPVMNWSIDELENSHADQTTVCFEPWQARLGSRKMD